MRGTDIILPAVGKLIDLVLGRHVIAACHLAKLRAAGVILAKE